MVSWLQHTAGRATDAQQRSGAARCAAGSRGPGRAAAGSAAPRIAALVAVALVMWNMRKRHFSHSCKTAAAEAAVKGAPFFGAFIGAKRRPFTDDRSGGYRA